MKLNRITTLLMLSTLPLFANSASYTIVELPTRDLSLSQFGSAIDETGLMLTTLNQPIHPQTVIDLDLLDVTQVPFTDPDAVAMGNFNSDDFDLISQILFANSANNGLTGQKLATQIIYKTDGSDFSYINGFDVESEATGGFSYAQPTTIGDAVNGTHIVGTMAGPYTNIPFTNETGVDILYTINQFSNRAVVQVGENIVELVPDDLTAGGVSSAEAINNNLQIAGTVGIGVIESLETAAGVCADDELRGDRPLEACLYSLRTANAASFVSATERRAVIWQVDANGELLDRTLYGLTFEPEDDVVAVLSTQATAINDDGVAVGTGTVPISTTFTEAAVVFENGETIRLLEDDNLLPNIANGINNNGYIVGYQAVRTTRTANRMFIYNRNTDDFVFSDGFFINSSTTPRAINNNNIVVGDAESEAGQGVRQRSGFVYDIDTDTFSNINELVTCDSGYNIFALNDINDSGEIIGDALVKRPARNFKGEVFLDSDGNEVLVDAFVAVKLMPTGEAASDCGLTDDEAALLERQGASVGILTTLGLLMISLFRRRSKTI